MAYTTAHHVHQTGLLRRIGANLVETLTWFVNIRTMIDQAERLSKLSDADLDARGTTRSAEIQRIFGPRAQVLTAGRGVDRAGRSAYPAHDPDRRRR